MLSSLLQKSSGSDHFFIIIIVLLLLILALSAWNWATTLPRPLQALLGWAAFFLALLLASELLPWQQYAVLGHYIGLEALKWMDDRPLIALLVLPALLVGSIFWRNPV
jgi:hypothetical protein